MKRSPFRPKTHHFPRSRAVCSFTATRINWKTTWCKPNHSRSFCRWVRGYPQLQRDVFFKQITSGVWVRRANRTKENHPDLTTLKTSDTQVNHWGDISLLLTLMSSHWKRCRSGLPCPDSLHTTARMESKLQEFMMAWQCCTVPRGKFSSSFFKKKKKKDKKERKNTKYHLKTLIQNQVSMVEQTHLLCPASFHRLPVKYRTEFKVVLFVFKALHGTAPSLHDLP